MGDLIGLIIILLGILGICQIMRYSELLTPIRDKSPFLDQLLSCSMCSGFHAAWIVLVLIYINPILIFPFVGSYLCSKFVR